MREVEQRVGRGVRENLGCGVGVGWDVQVLEPYREAVGRVHPEFRGEGIC